FYGCASDLSNIVTGVVLSEAVNVLLGHNTPNSQSVTRKACTNTIERKDIKPNTVGSVLTFIVCYQPTRFI
ncbi:MAG: hypothetical protein KHX99_03890, partial [Atopobium sp.]|nr:hypothetical protein [Atopobium sp.]